VAAGEPRHSDGFRAAGKQRKNDTSEVDGMSGMVGGGRNSGVMQGRHAATRVRKGSSRVSARLGIALACALFIAIGTASAAPAGASFGNASIGVRGNLAAGKLADMW